MEVTSFLSNMEAIEGKQLPFQSPVFRVQFLKIQTFFLPVAPVWIKYAFIMHIIFQQRISTYLVEKMTYACP